MCNGSNPNGFTEAFQVLVSFKYFLQRKHFPSWTVRSLRMLILKNKPMDSNRKDINIFFLIFMALFEIEARDWKIFKTPKQTWHKIWKLWYFSLSVDPTTHVSSLLMIGGTFQASISLANKSMQVVAELGWNGFNQRIFKHFVKTETLTRKKIRMDAIIPLFLKVLSACCR